MVFKNLTKFYSVLVNFQRVRPRFECLPHTSVSALAYSVNAVNKYTFRSHTCGELRPSDAGKEVVLCGWLEYQRLDKFGVLRDGYGAIQLIIPENNKKCGEVIEKLNLESVIKVVGTVNLRPKEQITTKMTTGEVEILVKNVDILNVAKANLPFLIRGYNKAKETLRMKYRYLDLRFPKMQSNLRLRSKMIMKMREYLINQCEFIEVETPTLFKNTPGGAREFIVPTHVKDQYFSLVQSPQQLKQLLMVGAIDRYFQVARCYRDEGARRDRQPEFTQLDIELSFLKQDDIFSLIEDLLVHSWPPDKESISAPFPRMTYFEAMEKYGSDKPDTSFDSKIMDCSSAFSAIMKESDVLSKKFNTNMEEICVHSISFAQTADYLTKSILIKFSDLVQKSFHDVILLPLAISSKNDSWLNKLNKIFPSILADKFMEEMKVSTGDLLILAFGRKDSVLPLLGQVRVEFADVLNKKNVKYSQKASKYNFMWITDFPLFTYNEDDGQIEASHHPFTQPHVDDLSFLLSDPLKVRGQHYDLVLNGSEIGGGSIRIHSHKLQRQILDKILNIPSSHLEHLLEALHSGCPPHGGVALGLDRLISIICEENSIRDVIAFPKSFECKDLMVGAPCAISDDVKKYYHQTTTVIDDEECNKFSQSDA